MKKHLPILIFCLFCLNCEQGWLKDILFPPVLGCTDINSCYYNSDAEEDDGSCIADTLACPCDSGNIRDCAGNCDGSSLVDNCGICDEVTSNDCTQDCAGTWGGSSVDTDGDGICDNIDDDIDPCSQHPTGPVCVVVDGCEWVSDGITGTCVSSVDCAGVLGGTALVDCAGVCGGDAVDSDGNGICDSDENNQTDCSDPNTCSNCTGCEASCCPNYCSGNYYYYNRSCSNGFCVGVTSDYCSDGCNDDGCIESTYGCTNPSACNFDANATIFDDSCWSATNGCACSEGEGAYTDNCNICVEGVTGLIACTQDECDVWGGDGIQQECGCGAEGQYGIPAGICDCNGNVENECGVCGGDVSTCIVCADCGNSECCDCNGNVYETVQIGTQLWMKENLKVTYYSNGTEIPTGHSNYDFGELQTGAYAVYPTDDDNASQTTCGDDCANVYGNLYNWYAVDDEKGLCPDGWHVPSDDEYTILIDYLGGESVAGGKMKETGLDHWNSPNTDATNESGFTALPAGFRYYDIQYFNMGSIGYFWSSSKDNSYDAWAWELVWYGSNVTRFNHDKNYGFSIRCIKD